MKYYIAIPTYNGGELWAEVVSSIKKNAPKDIFVQIVDSSSKDSTAAIAKDANFDVLTISSADFNHGGTRNLAIEKHLMHYDIVIFLTQDAIPELKFVEKIVEAFKDEDVACAYGRQLPHTTANPLARHARSFNYRDKSYVYNKDNIIEVGLKTVFISNSFSAYRLSVFRDLNGFPSNTILCEDMYYAAKAVLAGYKIAYVADAMVRHSHNYSPLEEFKRYFDIGVFHSDEQWIRDSFGGAKNEGKKFIFSEFLFLLKNAPLWIPLAFVNNFMKILGYKIGGNYKRLPKRYLVLLSMHKRFWGK